MSNTVARRAYLALAFGGLLWLGLATTRLAPSLPYGNYAVWVLAGSVLAAFLPGLLYLRDHILARSLVSGDLLEMNPEDVPERRAQTFLGFGFPWKVDHAERLYHAVSRGIEPAEEVQRRFGGNPILHGLGALQERRLFIENRKLPHHMLVLGSPGEGKTRFLELLLLQLVKQNDVVVVVDPKGDSRLIDAVVQAAREVGRAEDFRLVAPPWPKASAAYNPLANFSAPSEIADRLIGIFPPAGGESEAFRGFQWGATAAVAQGIFVADLPMTIARVLRYLREPSELFFELVQRRFPDLAEGGLARAAQRYRGLLASGGMAPRPELDDLLYYMDLDPVYYGKMTGSLLPQLERLAAGVKHELLSPEPGTTKKALLTWPSVVNRKEIVYFYLGSLHGEESAKALGKMLLLDLQAYLAARYSYRYSHNADVRDRRVALFIDESHHMISKPFLNILAEGRGAGVATILASQTTAQFEEAMGSKAAVDEILTNTHALVHFQSRNPRETKDFSDLVGKRWMRVIGEAHRYEAGFFGSGLKQVDDFRAQYTRNYSTQNIELVPSWAITQLPTFHFFARIGGQVVKGRIPLLSPPTSGFTREIMEKGAAA